MLKTVQTQCQGQQPTSVVQKTLQQPSGGKQTHSFTADYSPVKLDQSMRQAANTAIKKPDAAKSEKESFRLKVIHDNVIDTRPVRLDQKPDETEPPQRASSGASQWNKLGTYEEKDLSAGKVQSKLNANLPTILPDTQTTLLKVSAVEGDAFVKVARGKVKVGYTLSMVCDVEFMNTRFAIAVSDLCDYDNAELWEYTSKQADSAL